MNDLFATFYEYFFYNQDYQSVFESLYGNGLLAPYSIIGLIGIITPLITAIIFYFFIKNPWLKWWHWLITGLVTSTLIGGGCTYGYTSNILFELTQDPDYVDFANTIIWDLSFTNSIISFILFFIFSLVFKKASKAQGHLPF